MIRPILVRMVGSGRGAKMPSFHIDLHSGRGKSEADYLNGAVVRAGKQSNVSTIINQLLNETLLAMTREDIAIESYAKKPEKLLTQV